jgi:hypothetical protein
MSQLVLPSTSARDRLRMLGQRDLGAYIEIGTGKKLWSVQRRIASAVSVPRSKVVVPSCNASGKTHLAARIALAFYDSFKPGTPCRICKGPCGGAKIITTSSKLEHLEDNLWGEIRVAYPDLVKNVGFEGRLLPGTPRLEGGPHWWVIGLVAEKEEGFQGYHAAHKLILGDEATSIKEAVAHGITGLLASGDSRLFLILNPTTADTYAANMSRAPGVETIRITAWDTPHFTEEEIPEGSNLITPRFLEELKSQGRGQARTSGRLESRPSSGTWPTTTSSRCPGSPVLRDAALRGHPGARHRHGHVRHQRERHHLRDGNEIVWQRIFPSMRQDTFWQGPVTKAVLEVEPHYVIYDADGVGAGVSGYAETVGRKMIRWNGQILPFRGAMGVEGRYKNSRSMWWWNLRRALEHGALHIRVRDPKLESQLIG